MLCSLVPCCAARVREPMDKACSCLNLFVTLAMAQTRRVFDIGITWVVAIADHVVIDLQSFILKHISLQSSICLRLSDSRLHDNLYLYGNRKPVPLSRAVIWE